MKDVYNLTEDLLTEVGTGASNLEYLWVVSRREWALRAGFWWNFLWSSYTS